MSRDGPSRLSPAKRALLEQRLERGARDRHEGIAIPRRPDSESAPLSFLQRQMWVIDQMAPGNPAYNMPYGYRLRGPLDVPALERAFNAVIRRHEVLRTTFAVRDGEPVQQIHAGLEMEITVMVLDHVAVENRERELQALASAESVRPFDLSRLPLIRATLFRLEEAEHVLIVNLHHIVADGLSIAPLFEELDTFYRDFIGTGEARPPELAVQYGDFARWQRDTFAREPAYARQLDFWRKHLDGTLPVLELPTDRPRPATQSFDGANVFFDVPAPVARGLKALGDREGCTFFMTMLAAFQVLLRRYAGAEDLVVGTPVAVRASRELEPLIGLFLNMVALRCDLSDDPTFRELLGRTRETTLDAFSHGDLPLETLMKHLRFARDPSRNPVFQVALQMMSTPLPRLGHLDVAAFHFDPKFAQFDLTLHLYEEEGAYRGRFEYCTGLFDARTIERLAGHFAILLEAIVRDPDQRVATMPMLRPAERRQLLVDWSHASGVAPEADLCLHHLVEAQAARTPDRVAIGFDGRTVTYDALNRRANRLAHHLQTMGVGPDVPVALFVERSVDMLVGMLGILKAGGAYVPMDPRYPAERLRCILEDSGATIALTQQSLVGALPDTSVRAIRLDADGAPFAAAPDGNPDGPVAPEHLAYILFTSGSTGRPKGVELEHRSAVSLVDWAQRVFTSEELAGVLCSTSICFDLSVFEIFVPLSVGGRIVLARDVLDLLDLAERDAVTLINTVPSAMAELLRGGAVPPSALTVNLAGEALPASLAEQVYALPGVERVYNLYGPTEATTYSTYALVPRGGPVTIGRPITGTQCYVLDAHRHPLPVGVRGELYLGGRGLARGYCGSPDLTAQRFVPNPFSEERGARLYRTGDVCRWRSDGDLEYIGRLDHQVKVRGFRIEVGEVESAIARHAAVREVAVAAREDVPGEKRLVAYLVVEEAPDDLVEQVRAVVRSVLPEYMVPSRFVVLPEMPRTENGKLDRKALPAPAADTGPRPATTVAPRTPTESAVLETFQEVLGREDVGVFGSFFDLGGDSLMAARMVLRLRAVSGRDVPLRLLFERPTVAALAEAIDAVAWMATPEQAAAGERVEIEL